MYKIQKKYNDRWYDIIDVSKAYGTFRLKPHVRPSKPLLTFETFEEAERKMLSIIDKNSKDYSLYRVVDLNTQNGVIENENAASSFKSSTS